MEDNRDIEREIEHLSEELRHHQHLYYVKAQPQISDTQYDLLLDRLIALETKFPSLLKPDSPSQRVGSDLSSSFGEVNHTIPVLSLDKAYEESALLQWIEKSNTRIERELSYVVEEKIDGVSLVLYYQEGLLERAVTRGNGFVGNDITQNAKTIASIPLRLSQNLNVAVRGEVFLEKREFERLNRETENQYANPRNLAAGVLRRLKSSETAQFPLKMFVYDAYFTPTENSPATQVETMQLLKELGFLVNPSLGLFSNERDKEQKVSLSLTVGTYENLIEYVNQEGSKRESLPYEIDGLVLKVNELAEREVLGYTGHHPRWAIAFKFDSPEASTLLLAIDVQVGRTGRITPVGRVEPVKVGNSTVSNVTLHNQDYISMLELAIGDRITISKRGDVIPAVERVIEKNEEGNVTWTLPSHCPSCSTLLEKQGAHTFCPNSECPDQIRGQIEFFVGRNQMDIEGFGPETVALLMEEELLHDISDIYSIDYESLIGKPGFQTKKAEALKRGVEESKRRPFETLLISLGIPEVGKKAVQLLLQAGIKSIEELFVLAESNNREPLLAIKGVGEKTIDSLFGALQNKRVRTTIEKLQEAHLQFSLKEEKREELVQTFANQNWCITGSFDHFKPRSLAQKEIERRGGSVTSSVSRLTTHLLEGVGGGSKVEQALQYGAAIVTEEEFLLLLNEKES